jgi:hypothetical protein
MEENILVVVVEKGMVIEVYSPDANMKIIVVDEDARKVGEDYITEFFWPETQFDDERVEELLKERQ